MDRVQIALNLRKPGNYAFFCPVSRLHLTRSNPVGYVDRVTSAILMGLRYKTLLDVNGVVDLETGDTVVKTANNNKEKVKTETPTKQETKVTETKVTEDSKEKQVEQNKGESETSDDVVETATAEEAKKRNKKASK